MGKSKLILIFAAASAAVLSVVWLFVASDSDKGVGKDEDALVSRKARKAERSSKPVRVSRPKIQKTAKKVIVAQKPGFDIGEAEKSLNEEQRKLLEEIRKALREDDFRQLMKLVHRLQSSDEWPDGIPKAIKMAALKALGWYGGKTLPEVVGFLADLDREVVDLASSYWDDAIAELDHDVDLMDAAGNVKEAGIATNIKSASRVVNDPETMESILSEIQASLRHSVAVDTVKDILQNGNAVAKEKIVSAIEDLTGSEEIKTAEQLDEWLKRNPDDPDDDFMYGGKEDAMGLDDD